MTADERRSRRFFAALAAVVVLAYWPALTYGFLNLDDDLYVTGNELVQRGLTAAGVAWAFTSVHASNWYPLALLSHMLDVEVFGLRAWGHHLTSLLLHLASALLLFATLKRATKDAARSAAAAAVFALHPLQVESVAWIAERKNVLCGFFSLLSLHLYARGRRGWALAPFAAALISKPAAVPLPLGLLLLDRWPLGRKERFAALLKEKLPWLALSTASCAATLLAARGRSIQAISLAPRLANAALSYFSYLRKFAWPSGLAVFYPHPGSGVSYARAALAATALSALGAFVWRERRRRPWLASGLAWFFVMLVPTIGFVQVGMQAMADRYAYLPLIGLALALAWSVPPVAGGAFAVALLAVCARQVGYWSDSLTLFSRALAAGGESAFARENLCYELTLQGKVDEALDDCGRAVALAPGDAIALNDLGYLLAERGRFSESKAALEKALELSPGNPTIELNLTRTESLTRDALR